MVGLLFFFSYLSVSHNDYCWMILYVLKWNVKCVLCCVLTSNARKRNIDFKQTHTLYAHTHHIHTHTYTHTQTYTRTHQTVSKRFRKCVKLFVDLVFSMYSVNAYLSLCTDSYCFPNMSFAYVCEWVSVYLVYSVYMTCAHVCVCMSISFFSLSLFFQCRWAVSLSYRKISSFSFTQFQTSYLSTELSQFRWYEICVPFKFVCAA